jgi:hypothetical protein
MISLRLPSKGTPAPHDARQPPDRRGRRSWTTTRTQACGLKLAHDHAYVLLAEVLFAVTRNGDDDAGFVAKAPMARGLAAQFGKAVIS